MTLVLAHRGARRVAPENTLEAFRQARALGADGVELDVHATADGVLLVDHDGAPDGVGPIAAATFAAARAARPDIPALDEVLDECAGMLVNVEVKNLPNDPGYDPEHGMVDVLAALLEVRSTDNVLVSSFNLDTLDAFHARLASVPTGYLVMGVPSLAEAVELAAARGHQAVHPFVGMVLAEDPSDAVRAAHDAGVACNVWTVNEPDQMRALAAAGAHSIITDLPDLARSVLDSAPGS